MIQTVSQQKSWSYWVMIYQRSLLSCSTFLFLKVFSNQCKKLVKLLQFIKRIHNLSVPKIGQCPYYQTLTKFLKGLIGTNNPIYRFQFGFKQKRSTSHTDKIKEQLDKGNFACGIFCSFSKSFWHCRLSDSYSETELLWYKRNRTKFVSINGFDFDVNAICFVVPQSSILVTLLFLIYINDLHFAMKYCQFIILQMTQIF